MSEKCYTPPLFFRNGHIQTIFPVIFRKVDICYKRERITTFDNDFLDLDWSTKGSNRLAIISHGLEGSTDRAYVKGMVKAVNDNGWDGLAWNYRSCSGEPNRQLRSYHNGVTDDLSWVINHARHRYPYKEIALIGFSLGGNLTLLYLGRERPDPIVKSAVVFSVPCDLKKSARVLAKPSNKLYMKRFLVMLNQKIKAKMKLMPGLIDDNGYEKIRDFKAFDDRYTAPIHGFKNAVDYWEKCSSKPFIPNITVPTLIINAANDPFLPKACYPVKEVESNKQVRLCIPESGGHVGFVSFNKQNLYWSEKQAVKFLNYNSFLN
ncbi:MAG: alpha/beta hydrolase [Deltaproteobacteria bacterium]|nr:MAG: alpha/beta hydrolase [Deltaproteobacteria bacterium]